MPPADPYEEVKKSGCICTVNEDMIIPFLQFNENCPIRMHAESIKIARGEFEDD